MNLEHVAAMPQKPGDDQLNETCSASFEIDGYVSFHFKPISKPTDITDKRLRMREIVKQMRLYEDGLKEIAKRLDDPSKAGDLAEKYKGREFVAATSWITEENKPILLRAGFLEDFAPQEAAAKQALIEAYKRRIPTDGVPAEHRNTEPVAMRVRKGVFIARHGS